MLDTFGEVLAERLLLNHHFGGRDEAVDKRGVVEFDLVLVDDEGLGVLNTEDLVEERGPENLALAFFVAFSLPMGGKLLGGFLVLDSIHGALLCSVRFWGKGTTKKRDTQAKVGKKEEKFGSSKKKQYICRRNGKSAE